jgi:hypothetical protein
MPTQAKARATNATAERVSSRASSDRKAIVDRLYNILEHSLKLMEIRMESSGQGTAADRERDTRTIDSLTRAVGKITELDPDTNTAAGTASKSGNADSGTDEADVLRGYADIRCERYRELPHFWRFGRVWLRQGRCHTRQGREHC